MRPPPAEHQPLVSVVTPVYNGEKYLSECIESVLAQTYSNWEYVVVDNRSTDRSLEIAQRYERQDARIRVHRNTEFLGMLQNWNHALRQIGPESKYCKVVHADDILFPECLARMVELSEQHPSVGLVAAYRLKGAEVDLDRLIPYPVTVVSGRDVCRASLTGAPYVFGTPTSVLMRSDLVRAREAFYNEGNLHADTEACYDVLQESDFGFVHQVLTYTREHEEAMTSFATRTRTPIAGRLVLFAKYGPVFLDRDDYEYRLAARIARYAYFLLRMTAKAKFLDPQFREYHLATIRQVQAAVTLNEVRRGLRMHAQAKLWLWRGRRSVSKVRRQK